MESGELAQLRQTIERIEQMTPEEKERMQARIKRLETMQPGQARPLRDFYRSLSKSERESMRRKWIEMPREERRQWREKLRQMPPEQRVQILKENGFLPNHPRRGDAEKGKGAKPKNR
jgi:hypothetical protein